MTTMMMVMTVTTSVIKNADLKSLRVTLDDTGDDDIDKFEVWFSYRLSKATIEIYGRAEETRTRPYTLPPSRGRVGRSGIAKNKANTYKSRARLK